RGQDIPLLAVLVPDQGDPGRPVRVVLDMSDRGRLAVAIVPPPVDDPVLPLVPAAAVPRRDESLVIPTPRLLEGLGQALLGLLILVAQPGEVADRGVPPSGAGRFVDANSHRSSPLS